MREKKGKVQKTRRQCPHKIAVGRGRARVLTRIEKWGGEAEEKERMGGGSHKGLGWGRGIWGTPN